MIQCHLFFVIMGAASMAFMPVHGKKGFVIVPVADLMGDSAGKKGIRNPEHVYTKLPVCGGSKNPLIACPRVHQLLYNEIVDIIEEHNDELRIAIPNLFFITESNKKPHNQYWVLKKNIMSFDSLKRHNLPCNKIPDPINFSHHESVENDTVVTLCYPFYDPTTKQHFSAGTRFVCDNPAQSDNEYALYLFDAKKDCFKTTCISKKMCFMNTGATVQEKTEHFVNLLRSWTHLNQGIISYVWGGASFTAVSGTHCFEEIMVKNRVPCSYFYREGYTLTPKSGFDCTNLVARAAQICAIPYFFKNSTTIKTLMQPLKQNETIQEGDLIWVPGHVMIVADLKQNTLIEARHYAHGYGKVHEIELNKVFKNISTFKDLESAYAAQTPLERIDSKGMVKDIFKEFKILPLKNIAHT